MTTAAIIVGVVLVITLRGVSSQFAAGIVIQSRRPYTVGDEIESLGFRGLVTGIDSYSTVLRTWGGRTVHLPNTEVLANPIVNRTVAGVLRMELAVRARTGDRRRLVAVVLAAAAATPGVLDAPAPVVSLVEVSPSRTTCLLRVHHASDAQLAPLAGRVVGSIATALDGEGIEATVVATPPPPPFTPMPDV